MLGSAPMRAFRGSVAAALAALAVTASAAAAALPATGMTQAQLKAYAKSAAHAVYWTGARSGYTYEVTGTSDGRIYVRYLPAGVEAGDKRASFLVVGTYRLRNAYAATRAAAKRLNAPSVEV